MGSSKAKTDQDKEQFLKLIDLLLSDMKLFKQLVRKSLNLLQGMELMNAGYLFAVNKVTGAASTSSETRLATHHHNQASFPALRLATYKCTVQVTHLIKYDIIFLNFFFKQVKLVSFLSQLKMQNVS